MTLAAAFSDIALGFSTLTGAPYHDARVIHAGAATLDDGGSIVTAGTATARTCKAQVDVATDAMRATDGFVEGDVRILVLAHSLVGAISTDETIQVLTGPHAGTYSIQSVERDAAGIGYQLRGRLTDAVTVDVGPPVTNDPEYDPGDLVAVFEGGLD